MIKWHSNRVGKILLDKNLIILSINKEAIKVLHLKKEKFIGSSFLIYLSYKARKVFVIKFQIILYKQANNSQYKFLLKDKKTRPQIINFSLKTIFHKRKNFFQGINVTFFINKKTYNKKENTYPILKSINNLSHDLRAPLTNIQSFLETLYEYNEELTNKQRLEFIEIATNETNRLSKLVNNILDFAILRNKEVYRKQATIHLEKIIHQIWQFNQLAAVNKKIILIQTITINERTIFTSYDFIFRIVSNLLNNSIKFTYPSGIINIKIKLTESIHVNKKKKKCAVRISIIDTGIGISKKDIFVIFDRFSRVNNIKNIIIGSGLGLSIIKEVLNKTNQQLNLSTCLGKGTTASFGFFVSIRQAGEGT